MVSSLVFVSMFLFAHNLTYSHGLAHEYTYARAWVLLVTRKRMIVLYMKNLPVRPPIMSRWFSISDSYKTRNSKTTIFAFIQTASSFIAAKTHIQSHVPYPLGEIDKIPLAYDSSSIEIYIN